jgi:hypothetical protein
MLKPHQKAALREWCAAKSEALKREGVREMSHKKLQGMASEALGFPAPYCTVNRYFRGLGIRPDPARGRPRLPDDLSDRIGELESRVAWLELEIEKVSAP